MELRTDDTDKIEITDQNKIKAIGVGWVSIDVYYNDVYIKTLQYYVIESIVIVNKPENNTIKVGETYESLGAKEMPTDVFCEAEWQSSDESIAEIYYDLKGGRVVLKGKSEGSVWISATDTGHVKGADGFWLYVDLIPVESFNIVNHSSYKTFANNTAYIGDNGFLEVNTTPSNAYYNEVEWYVNKGGTDSVDFIGSIEKGDVKIRVEKAGTIEIGAKIDGMPAKQNYIINVKAPKATITNKPQNNAIYKGGTHTLDCKKDPTEATVEWVSKNESIATINSDGKITAKASGYVVISIRITYNNRTYTTDSFTLNVRNQWIWVDGYDSTTLIIGEDPITLRADVGANAGDDRTVAWETSNSSIASVANGVVTAKAPGMVTITAYLANHREVSWPVVFEVKSPITITNVTDEKVKLDVGQSFQLKYAIISSKISVNTITWDVVDDDIAKISSNGNIIALKAGNTKVKVYINGNSSLCDEIELSVCLTQKSYIYYTNFDDAELRCEIAQRDKRNLANKFYGGDTSKVVLKLIEGKTDFKNYWNNMDDNLGYVIINCIGGPELLDNFNSNDNLERSISVQEIKGLNKKNMEGLILLSCNGGHLDYDTDKGNVAMAFSRIINGAPVIASDGSVTAGELDSHEYENRYSSVQDEIFVGCLPDGAYTPTRINKSGWYIYYYANHSVEHTAVANSVYNQKDYDDKTTKITLTFSKILESIHNFEVNEDE